MLGELYWKQQRKKRNAERRRLAASRGWHFVASDPALLGRWHGEPFARPGDRRETVGVIRGDVKGVSFTAFDFRMRTSAEISSSIVRGEDWYTRTIWVLHLPAPLPWIGCERARLAQKIADRLEGTKAIRTGDDAFDNRFVLYSSSPEFVCALLTPRLRRWLRQHNMSGWWVCDGDLLLTSQTWFRVRPGQLVAVAEQMAEMVSHFPVGIWERYGLGWARTQ